MITENQTKKLEYIKNILTSRIKRIILDADALKDKLAEEVNISLVYLEIFSDWLQEKKFETIEEAMRFMNDIKGIIEKIFYVDNYLNRVRESMKK